MEKNLYTLTNPQKSIYLTEEYYKGTNINNIAGTITINQPVQFEKLKEAIKQLIKQNDGCRIMLSNEEQEVKQWVAPYQDFQIEIIDVASENELSEVAKKITSKPFSLYNSYLFKFVLYRFPDNHGGFIINMHHLIADSWSMGIAINEIMEIYSSYLKGEEHQEKDTTLYSYTNYITAEQEYKKSDKYQKDKAYWEEVFSTIPESATIPSIQTNATTNNFSKALREQLSIPSNLLNRIKEYCSSQKVSVYNFLTAIFSIYISRVSNLEDICIGTPILNRANFKEKNTTGMFINTLPIRVKMDTSMSFSEFLNSVMANSMALLRHQKYSYQNIIEELRKKQSNLPALYQIMISYQITKINEEQEEIPHETKWIFNGITADDIDIHIFDLNDTNELNIAYDYKTEKYTSQEMKQIHERILSIISQVLNKEDITLSEIEIVTLEEKEKLIHGFNQTKMDYPKDKTIAQLFEEQVKLTPNNVALVFEDKSLTYQELNEKANQLAYYLREKKIKNNDIVGIMVNRSLEMIVGILAVLKSGGAYIPIDPDYPSDRIDYVLENSNCYIVLTDEKLFDKIRVNCEKVDIKLNNQTIYTLPKENLQNISKPNDLSYLIYTSGSTGKPKGVMLTQKALVNLTYYCNEVIPYLKNRENISIVSVTTISFDIFIFETLISLQRGLKLVIANSNEQTIPHCLNDLIKKENIQAIQTTPSRMQLFYQHREDIPNLSNLKYITLAGEPLRSNLKNDLLQLTKGKIFNGYGPSETTVFSTLTDVTNQEEITIGKPLANTQIYILDNNLNVCPIGVAGEIYIAGDGVGLGYMQNPNLTQKSFIPNLFSPNTIMYKTGDIGFYKENGEIICLGRTDHQVKIRGLRIELEEIENVIMQYQYISSCVVVKKVSSENHEFLCAYYTANKSINENELRTLLKSKLPNYMIPQYYIKLDSLPYTPNGKVDKKALPDIDFDQSQNHKEIVKPRNEIDKTLISFLLELLKIKDISINDSFYDLGGDSLSAIQLCSIIYHELGIEIAVKDILTYPIIKDLSDFISTKGTKKSVSLIEAVEKREYYPVSSAQKRMYYASSLDGDNSLVYNIAGGVILDKTLNKEKLEKCFNTIINRHESLRTYFEIVEGNIVQKILDKIDFKLDFENVNTNDVDKLFNDFVKPFNLNKAPLFNAKLININNEKSFLLLNMHHIISDGTSFSVLIDELCKLYNSENNLPELTISYKDFAVWENNKINSEEFNKDKEFWVNQFNDEIPLLNMPTNYTRPNVQSFEGDNVFSQINSNLTSKINEVSKQLGITPYMLLLSVYYILLYKYTGQNDIVVGSPIVGRDNIQLTNMIGMFVNSLALRNKIDSSMSFKEFTTEIKNNCLNAFEHQTYPFDELVSALEIKRDTSRNPLFDTMFIYQNNGNATTNFDGIKSEVYTPKSNVAKFDLSLEVMPENSGLTLRFEYCTKLFNKDFITRLSKHYLNILQTIIKENEIKIANIDMLSKEEKEQILNDFNNTKANYPKDKTVIQLFEEQAEKNPNGIAVIFEEQKLTYKELNEKANQMAHCLIENGVKDNDIISVCMNKNIPFIISVLGILKCGCAYLPINPTYPINRIEYIVTDSNSKIFITDTNYEIKGAKTLTYNTINLNKYEKNTTPRKINNNDLAYVIYTSGSTGNPKGVMVTNQNLVNFLFSFNNCFKNKFGNKDNCLSLTNISFDVSVCEIFTPLAFGATLTLYPENTLTSISLLSDILTKNKVTFLYIPPSVLNDVADYIITNNIKVFVDKLLVGVEAIKNSTLNKFLEINKDMEIINGYGPTETTICTTFYLYKKSNNLNENVPIGYPISNSKIYILDKDSHIAPIGVIGELCVSGDNVSKGYLNNEELTKKSFIHNEKISKTTIYKTGDLAYWTQNGTLSFIGRNDSQIKFKGHRIELNEINSTLKNMSNVTNSYTMIRKVNNIDSICSFITTSENINVEDIYSYLKKNLPYYMIPSHIITLETFPLTLNGKIDKKVLQEYEIANTERLNYVAPENETQKLFCDTWEKLLNTKVGITDDIFELGADSLLAIKFKVEILSHNIDVQYSDIFKYPTIKEFYNNIIDTISNQNNANIIPKAENQEYYPVSSAQKRMYYASSLDGDNSLVYNIAGGVILDKTLNKERLEKCFNTIINRHESLRTYFEIIEGNIVQKILDKVDFKLEFENVNTNDVDKLFNDFVKPFNLNKAPLFNAKLININNEKSFLLLNMHHIISDGTSFSVLIDELCKLYNNESNLPELTISYKDFAVWENSKINSDEFNKDKEFWVNQFNDEIPLLNMPTNYTRPSVQSFEGDNVFSKIDSNLTLKINEVSKQLGITPYMLLLSVYYILLYKYTGQNDIVVGSPIVGRDNVQLSNIIGMFVNSLAIRNKIDSSMSFKEFTTEIKNNCLNAFEHQTYPFDELVSALEIKRDTSRNPLFDTMFIYQNNGNATTNFDGIESEVYTPKTNISKFDLSLEIIPENNNLNLRFEYCTKLFNKDFITRLSKHYLNILQTIIEENEIKIANIDMLSKEEKEQILNDFNNTKANYPKDKTVIQLFEEQAEKNPNGIAVIFEEQKLTYKELNEKANQMANCLIENGVKNNDIVGIMLNRSFETIISMLAVLKADAAYMLIDVNLPEDRIIYMLKNADSALLITASDIKNIDFNKKLFVDKINADAYQKNNLNLNYNIKDNLSIVYTSGSTGNPKGVLLIQQGMINLMVCYKKFIDIENFSKFLSICSISFDMFAVEIFIPLLNNKTLILANEEEHKDPIAISKLIKTNCVEFMLITPSKIQLLLANDSTSDCLQNLKSIQLGGEIFTANLFETLKKYTNAQICNEYGPSEITSCCSYKEIISANDINIGGPIHNVQIYILNQDMNLCPIGVDGEICVSGDGISKGYINNHTATEKVFVKNPFVEGLLYKTGDIGKYNASGEIEYIGRKDFQVKLRGLRIELSEIEKQLLNIENIKNCAVIYKEEPNNNSYLAAFFTSAKDIDISFIRTELSKHLPLYMVPKYIIKLDNMPITRNGKIDLKTLKEYKIENVETSNYVAPENETQKLFCDTWEKLLNTKVGITDDIFELGADSLLAIKFKVEILSHNINIEYADIFKYPTVKELSEAKSVTTAEQTDSYNYDEINKILEKNNIKNSKNMITNKTNNVLLLGSNGFVGMHILYNFIKKDNGKIYCIVRDKNKISARTRILDALHFYFNSELDDFIDNRIVILKGDITKENFGLNTDLYNDIVDNVSIVINSSANVRHYGNFKNFEDINIGLTQKAIEFCEKYNKRLIQISTTSVSGEVNKNENISFSENNLYIGQNLDNVYVKSKFEAERIILEHISKGLKAQILRLGNITNRYIDGKFQINPNENAFIGRIQSFIKLGIIPDYLLNAKLEFTPVDLCGLAIVTIMQNYVPDFSVFHIFNNNYITMKDFVETLRKYNVNLKVVNDKEFDKKIKEALLDESKKNILSGIVNELNLDNNFEINANVDILSEFSRSFLYTIDFNWSKIDNGYIEKYIKYFKNIKFI